MSLLLRRQVRRLRLTLDTPSERAGWKRVLAKAGRAYDAACGASRALRAKPLSKADGGVVRGRIESTRSGREERVRRDEVLAAKARQVAGLAHDFNNLLSIVLGGAEAVLERLDPEDPSYASMAEVLAATQHAATLGKELLAFYRHEGGSQELVSVNDVVSGVERMLHPLLPANIKTFVSLDDDFGHVRIDPCQMERIVLNLATNARDAMRSGGRLVIRTFSEVVDEERALASGLSPGLYVALEVEDSGVGMTAEVQRHAFEPFFTTKGEDGTGLGLTTVFEIVRAARGAVNVTSLIGMGTKVRVLLPTADHPMDEERRSVFVARFRDARSARSEREEPPRRAERIAASASDRFAWVRGDAWTRDPSV